LLGVVALAVTDPESAVFLFTFIGLPLGRGLTTLSLPGFWAGWATKRLFGEALPGLVYFKWTIYDIHTWPLVIRESSPLRQVESLRKDDLGVFDRVQGFPTGPELGIDSLWFNAETSGSVLSPCSC